MCMLISCGKSPAADGAGDLTYIAATHWFYIDALYRYFLFGASARLIMSDGRSPAGAGDDIGSWTLKVRF